MVLGIDETNQNRKVETDKFYGGITDLFLVQPQTNITN
jgi:hypothetical protein